MEFETITMVPFDLEAVIPEMLSPRERELLNRYHQTVYEKISPFLEGERKRVAERSYPPDFQISSFYNIKKPMFCACYFHRTSVFLISFPYNTSIKILSGAGAADLRRIPAAYSPPEYFPR